MDRLDNPVRTYAWGSTTAIPELLGTEPTGEPQAELWMGAHPAAPSRIDRGGRDGDGEAKGSEPPVQQPPQTLAEAIDRDPESELGRRVLDEFGPRLPFLLKLLAAASPLSLQVHPDRGQAQQGFADEEERGVPADAAHRNYKDAQHKPELLCALTPFEGLCGFRRAAGSADLLAALGVDALQPYVDILRASPESDALREVLTAVLTADRTEIAGTVAAAGDAAARLAGDPSGSAPHPYAESDAAAYAAYASIARHYPGDPGVIAAMLLNHVRLRPGEALWLGAGVPHAYLGGLGVEIMANSDNVLRCGLTAKHVDVPELLRVVRFESGAPAVLCPEADPEGEEVYETPIDEFRLSRRTLAPGAPALPLPVRRPQILLCTDGRVDLRGDSPTERSDGEPERQLTLERGQSAYVPAGEGVRVSGDGTLFRATVAV